MLLTVVRITSSNVIESMSMLAIKNKKRSLRRKLNSFFSLEFFENIFIVLCPPMAALGGCEQGTRDFALLFQTVKRYCARLKKGFNLAHRTINF